MKKYELYLISLSMLFFFVLFLTLPYCWGSECNFVGLNQLFTKYLFSFANFFLLVYSCILMLKLKIRLKSNSHTSFKVNRIENKSYEHLVFLTTYIIPLVAFDFSNYKYQALFMVLIFFIGLMYSKTDMYFSNPSLAILGYSIFNVEGIFRGNRVETVTVLSKDRLKVGDEVPYLPLSDEVYIGRIG